MSADCVCPITTSGTGTEQFFKRPGYVAILVSSLDSNDPIIVPLDKRPLPGEEPPQLARDPAWPLGGHNLVVYTTHTNNQARRRPIHGRVDRRSPCQAGITLGRGHVKLSTVHARQSRHDQ